MSLLLMSLGVGLPRNGLIALWDPYRDTYGRNVLATTVDTLTNWTASGVTLAATSITDTTETGVHFCYKTTGIANGGGRSFAFAVKLKASNGMAALRLGQNNTNHTAIVNLTTGVVVFATGCSVSVGDEDGDGYRRVSLVVSSYLDATYTDILTFIYTAPTTATNYATLGYTGSAETPITVYAKEFQLNLGSTLFPYSAPSGAPGTVQTSLDYSGNGNHLTLGATTGASTDDPAFTGTAWSFDGGDFLISPLVKSTAFTWLVAHKPASDCPDICHVIATQSGFSGGYGFVLGAWGGKSAVRAYLSTADRTTGALSFNKGVAWVAGMRFGPNIDLMVGGVTAETAVVSNNGTTAAWGMKIGAATDATSYPYKGDIYFIAMWSRCLTNAEWMRSYLYVKSLEARRGVTLA